MFAGVGCVYSKRNIAMCYLDPEEQVCVPSPQALQWRVRPLGPGLGHRVQKQGIPQLLHVCGDGQLSLMKQTLITLKDDKKWKSCQFPEWQTLQFTGLMCNHLRRIKALFLYTLCIFHLLAKGNRRLYPGAQGVMHYLNNLLSNYKSCELLNIYLTVKNASLCLKMNTW